MLRINIPSNSNFTIEIPISINDSTTDNIIEISVCPVSEFGVECKTIILNANTCSTNPGYYFSDMSICPELLYGDINQDTLIDILDIILMVDIIMEDVNPENHVTLLADINHDNNIDIFDVVLIINIILS